MKCINIFGKTYKIEYKDLTGMPYQGQFKHEDALIVIHSKLGDYEKQQTLMHEMLHAVLDRLSISDVVDERIEEILVDSIATFLCENFSFDF
jgi:Zn-dependent peptidase ImmA (M78 family)